MLQFTINSGIRLSVSPSLVLTAPKMWYQADYGVTYDNAGDLTGWQDASGNEFHLVPNGGKAALSPDTMNGYSMVRVSGPLATVGLCGITSNMPRTVYFLGRLVTGNVIVSCGGSGFGNLFECMQASNSPLLHAYGLNMDNWYTLANQPVNAPALWAWRYNGAGGGFSDFNANRGPQGGPPHMDTVNTSLYIAWGDYYKDSTIDVLEILVYDRFLNTKEDQQIRNYLGTKGNVPVAIPS